MPKIIAIVVADSQTSRLGQPSRIDQTVAGGTVLEHTIERLSRIDGIDTIVTTADVETRDGYTPMIVSSRKWALSAWRGGLGGSTCYDELLPAAPLLRVMDEHDANSALLVGGDWMLVDPQLCRRVIELHLENPDEYQMTFCQAPPGLCGIVAGRELLAQFAEKHAGFSQLVTYVPQRPQADPIGRDVCVQIAPQVRGCMKRFIYDTDRTCAMINDLAERFGSDLINTDAQTLCEAAPDDDGPPRQYTLELTPARPVDGPLTPQHHVDIDRDPITLDAAKRIIDQIAKLDDAVLTLGGLGDALEYPRWRDIVTAAHDAGVFGICVETDLHVDHAALDDLLALPIDVISVRLNADTAETYVKTMGTGFDDVMDNIQHLLQHRARRAQEGHAPGAPRVPWIVPRLIKTADTLKDMETFFERWMTYTHQAVIEPAMTGCGLMPDFAPLDMAPPKRRPCRQLTQRITIHADGRVPRCDQDWLARASAGSAAETDIDKLWQSQQPVRDAHDNEQWQDLELCNGCREWHRP